MTNKETLQVVRRVFNEITLNAWEGLLRVLDVMPDYDSSFYPIPTRSNNDLILLYPGYKIVVEPNGNASVYISFSLNRDHTAMLLKLVSQYSQSVQGQLK